MMYDDSNPRMAICPECWPMPYDGECPLCHGRGEVSWDTYWAWVAKHDPQYALEAGELLQA